MGSVVISEVVSDIARYPHTMVVGDADGTPSTGSERNQVPSARAHNPQSSHPNYTPHRYPDDSHAPTAGSSASLSRLASQQFLSGRTINGSASRAPVITRSSEAHSSTPSYSSQAAFPANIQVPGLRDGFDQSGFPLTSVPRGLTSSPPSPRLLPTLRSSFSLSGSGSTSPTRIKVRDLNHIQSFASEEVLTRNQYGSRNSLRARHDSGQQYEISSMPVTDIIEMVAGLLTKIIATNDRQHEHIHRHIPPPEGASGLSEQTTSVLAFHGKNVPSITILSYLSRIHKYCPTTYEVFLSLLVYFDRMTEIINNGTLPSFRPNENATDVGSDPSSRGQSIDLEVAKIEGDSDHSGSTMVSTPPLETRVARANTANSNIDDFDLSHFFVVDSFNIHRLVIAGVTCASKFFSDVFYTNSRYAKVGGLPLPELNHLELQFLLLNDFRLSVPVEELEAYGSMLVGFYAEEVIAQQQQSQHPAPPDALYIQPPGGRAP